MIDGITQFGVISLDLPVIIAMGEIWRGVGSYGGGGVRIFLKGGFVKRGVLENPLNPPLATGLEGLG